MPFKDPAAAKRYQAAWYQKHKKHHKARAAARYKTNRQLRLKQIARYRTTAAGILNEVRSSAKRRQG